MSKFTDLQLTDAQREILLKIKDKGRFLYNPITDKYLEVELKNLMWKEFIERDKSDGLHLNIFIPGWLFPIIEQLDF